MKSILVGLTLTLWIAWFPAYTQSDTVYCLPIGKARKLVADALRLPLVDSMRMNYELQLSTLSSELVSVRQSYTKLINLSEQKYQKQKEITSDFVRLSEGWKKESEYYQKRSRKFRRQRNGLAVIALGILVLAAVK